MQEVIPFDFNGIEVRTIIDKDGNPWWVARDVCVALGIQISGRTFSNLKPDEKRYVNLGTPGEEQIIRIISESGFYTLIIRSNKPKAEPFRRWIFREILPSIRKTGYYSPNVMAALPDCYNHALGIAIDGLDRSFDDEWIVDVNGSPIKLTTNQLLSQTQFRRAVVNAQNILPHEVPREIYKGIIRDFLHDRRNRNELRELLSEDDPNVKEIGE